MHRDKADAPGTVPYVSLCKSKFLYAVVMELADMQDLGSCAAMRVGSTPINRTRHQLPEFTETHIHRVSDAIQPFHPLLSPSPPAPNPSQQLFT